MTKTFEFNADHIDECLERIHVIQGIIQYIVSDHIAVQVANCQPEIDEIQDLLASVYQRIGHLSDVV